MGGETPPKQKLSRRLMRMYRLIRGHRNIKYVPYEVYMEGVKKEIERLKKENELLKANGYRFKRITRKEATFLADHGYSNYLDGDYVVITEDGKLVNRYEALKAIKTGHKPETRETLGEIYGRLLGIEGTDKQKDYAGKILLETLWVLDEVKKLIPYYRLRHKDYNMEKMEKALDVVKEKIKATKDAKRIIKLKAVLNSDKFKEQANALLDALNLTGEKGKKFTEEVKKILDEVAR